jgi:hypothetical protein
MTVKLTGERSIASKLHRLAYELEHDAARVRTKREDVADALKQISKRCGALARSMENDQ